MPKKKSTTSKRKYGGGTRTGNSVYMVRARARQAQALEMRVAGKKYYEIAEKLGYKTEQGVKYALEKALDKMIDPKVAGRCRALLLERYEVLLEPYMKEFLDDNTDVERRDKVFEKIIKALDGIGKVSGAYKIATEPGESEADGDTTRFELKYVSVKRFDKSAGDAFYGGPNEDEIELPEPLQKILDKANEIKVIEKNGKQK